MKSLINRDMDEALDASYHIKISASSPKGYLTKIPKYVLLVNIIGVPPISVVQYSHSSKVEQW